LTAFIITGDCDEASAKLKAALEASDARFNANLEALFKSPPPPAAPAAGPHASAGWALATNRDNADSLHGRLRTSLRVPRSR
jgi:hypothetical protein